ncbi:MAG: Inner rane transport permease YbhR [Planctomycetota bacterium]
MRATLAIAGKDLRLLFRDKGEVFFTFLFPIVIAIFFGMVFGGGGGGGRGAIALALVVESDAPLAARLADALAADAAFTVTRHADRAAATDAVRAGKATAAVILPEALGAGVDQLFNGRGIPVEAVVDPSRRAEAALIEGKLNELVFRQFPTLFADADAMSRMLANARAGLANARDLGMTQRLAATGLITAAEAFVRANAAEAKEAAGGESGDEAGDESGDGEVDATSGGTQAGDPDGKADAEPASDASRSSASTAGSDGTTQPTRNAAELQKTTPTTTPTTAPSTTPTTTPTAAPTTAPTRAWSPIAVTIDELPPRTGRPRSSFDVTFPQGAVWGLAGCVAAFAASLVRERARGTLVRLTLAPITIGTVLAGKGLACFVAAMAVQALLVALAVVGFGSTIAQPAMLLLACTASAFAFAGLAMLIAGLCRTEAEADGAGRGAILIFALVGGGTIPLFFMPPFLRTLSYGSPFRWAVAAIEGPFWRDTPVAEQLAPLAVLVAIGFLGWIVGARGLWRSTSR